MKHSTCFDDHETVCRHQSRQNLSKTIHLILYAQLWLLARMHGKSPKFVSHFKIARVK